MKKLLLALLLSACGSDHSPDAGKKVVSLDLLGILHEDFPCEKYLEEMKDATEINIGYLAGGTFGESRECIDRILSDERTNNVRLHLCNGSCLRFNRCHSAECSFRLRGKNGEVFLPAIEEAVRSEFSRLPSGRSYYISPILEHEFSSVEFDKAAELVLRLADEYGIGVSLVENPVYPHPSRWLLEVHGEFDPVQMPYLYSTDGYFFDPRVLLSLHEEALVAFEWRPEFNGLCTDGSDWVSPLERKCF